MKELHEEKLPVPPEELAKDIASCTIPRAQGNLFVESDLKIQERLKGALLSYFVDIADYRAASLGSAGQNGFSHEVKLQIVTSGSVNAVRKLAAVATNTATLPFFATSRDRTQDVIITFGPLAKKASPPQLASAMENAQFAREIGQAVAEASRQVRQ